MITMDIGHGSQLVLGRGLPPLDVRLIGRLSLIPLRRFAFNGQTGHALQPRVARSGVTGLDQPARRPTDRPG
jgi:hypothetical protein